MDLDAFSEAHSAEWHRLAELSSTRRPTGAEADELIERYQAGATDLSVIRTTTGESLDGDRLSVGLARARLLFTGTSENALSRLPVFFALQLPAALYRIRWLCVAAAVASAVVAVAYGLWVANDPRVFAKLSENVDTAALSKDFVDYYSNYSGGSFSAQVWTNNAFLAAQCIAFGITGIWAPYALYSNAQNLGLTGGMMAELGHADQFWLYIAPHGQLELYSIFVAAAAGMRIFWAWVAPGTRTRAAALAQDARALFTVVIGLVLSLAVSGTIEGFVTRQPWPWPIKIGIGTIALAAFLVYQWVVGRRAYRAGSTGDLEEFEAGARTLVAG